MNAVSKVGCLVSEELHCMSPLYTTLVSALYFLAKDSVFKASLLELIITFFILHTYWCTALHR